MPMLNCWTLKTSVHSKEKPHVARELLEPELEPKPELEPEPNNKKGSERESSSDE